MKSRERQRESPARRRGRAARPVRRGAARRLRLPARALREPAARRRPHGGDVPRRRRGRAPGAAADADHRLAERDRPSQARRPRAGRRARAARAALRPRRRRRRAGPGRPVGRAARRAARQAGPGTADRRAPRRAHLALPRRAPGPGGRPRARPHRARDGGAPRAGPHRVPPQLHRTRGGRTAMTDPFDALRIPLVPVPPDPDFARALRARVERALLGTDEEPAPLPEKMALHAVTPYLIVVDAPAALAFYVAAFGARRRGEPIAMPDGRIGHAEIVIGDSVLMLAEEFPELDLLAPIHRGGASQSLHVELDDPDAAVERAVAPGAGLERPVTDSSHGPGRVVRDPSGHRWMVSAQSGPRPGEISYASLWTHNVALAGRFYARVLGWTTVPSPDREGRPVRQVTDLATPVGIRGTDRAPTLVLHYVVPDVDAAVALVRAAGGSAGA